MAFPRDIFGVLQDQNYEGSEAQKLALAEIERQRKAAKKEKSKKKSKK